MTQAIFLEKGSEDKDKPDEDPKAEALHQKIMHGAVAECKKPGKECFGKSLEKCGGKAGAKKNCPECYQCVEHEVKVVEFALKTAAECGCSKKCQGPGAEKDASCKPCAECGCSKKCQGPGAEKDAS